MTQKTLIALSVILSLAICTSAFAGNRGKRIRGSHGGGKSAAIRGICSVLESATNPIAGPCVNTLLILNDSDGNEISKERTNAQGDFEFAAEGGKNYKIQSGSRSYDVVSPDGGAARGGAHVELKLQQK